MSTPSHTDGGAAARILTRMRRSLPVPVLAAAVIAAVGWGPPRLFVGLVDHITGGVIVALCLAVVPMLARRMRLYRRAQTHLTDWPGTKPAPHTGWTRASCTTTRPLSPPSRAWLTGRREDSKSAKVLTTVVAVRAESGPLAPSMTLFVRGREDGVIPEAYDTFYSFSITDRGPFLLGRPSDGTLFVADTWKSAPR